MAKEDDKKETTSKDLEKTVKDLAKSVQSLAALPKTLEGLIGAMTAMNAKVDGLADAGKRPAAKPKTDVTSETLEDMDNGQLANHILEQVVEKVGKPIIERLETMNTDTTRKDVSSQVKEAETAHADFWEWREDMSTIAKDHPDLPIEKIYQLPLSEQGRSNEQVGKSFR